MSPTYTDVFGGANIYPSEITYSAVTLTEDIVLYWPEETSESTNLATKIMDVTPTIAGLSIYLPHANKSSTGNTILFNNRGAVSFTVRNADGVEVVLPSPSTLWQIYITDNSTVAGLWNTLQYGATTSIANAASLAGTGIIAVGSLLSQSVPITEFNVSYTVNANDRAKMFNWTSALGDLYLPDATTLGNNWFIYLRNSGSGDVTVTPAYPSTINGVSSMLFQPEESAIIVSDGVNYYTIGFGQNSLFAFDYVSVDISGSGSYVLSSSELNKVVYQFIGTLTGDMTVFVPNTVQQYWVNNQTVGDYIVTISAISGGGSTVSVDTGVRAILYCDGINVLTADTSGVAFPITVAQGGTGAVTSSTALVNLGGTSVGTAIFTAINTSAAWTALGQPPSGVINGGTF